MIDRYEKVFGMRNRRFMIGGVEFISTDAQAIDGLLQTFALTLSIDDEDL